MSATVEIQDSIATITMDDGKANAINPDMVSALNGALDRAEADAKAVIVTGRPGRFSGGFDLKYFQTAGPEGMAALVNDGGRLAHRIYGFPMPVIGAISGHAIAMGCFIAQSCDMRIGMAGDFKIGANETAIDMVLPVFAQELLHARVRSDRLTETAILARLYDPEAAVEVGYLDQVAEPDALITEAATLARMLAELPVKAYAGNKRAIRKDTLDAIEASLPG